MIQGWWLSMQPCRSINSPWHVWNPVWTFDSFGAQWSFWAHVGNNSYQDPGCHCRLEGLNHSSVSPSPIKPDFSLLLEAHQNHLMTPAKYRCLGPICSRRSENVLQAGILKEPFKWFLMLPWLSTPNSNEDKKKKKKQQVVKSHAAKRENLNTSTT